MAPKITIDKDLRELIPSYLKNRNDELPQLAALLAKADYEALRRSGHQLAGSGGGYGFDRISEIGKALESAAREGRAEEIVKLHSELECYLKNLEIVYE
jgi:HPt (histidine-containing phosphotransfer) domain-containing protein